jgi:hypothetical protein
LLGFLVASDGFLFLLGTFQTGCGRTSLDVDLVSTPTADAQVDAVGDQGLGPRPDGARVDSSSDGALVDAPNDGLLIDGRVPDGGLCSGVLCGSFCVDTRSDPRNCGGCGSACPATEVCSNSACRPANRCATGLVNCNGSCVNTQTDLANCGGCGVACTGGASCRGGACTCPLQVQGYCGGACIDMTAPDAADCMMP